MIMKYESCFTNQSTIGEDCLQNNMGDTNISPATGYMEIAKKLDIASLLPIIKNVARENITINCDE